MSFRIVSLIELAKGVLVLLAGFGVLAFIHKDLHAIAEEIVRQFHLNPANHYPRIFIDLAGNLTSSRLRLMALFAAAYACVRFTEGYGLWRQRAWAAWFGIASGGIYVPIELVEVARKASWQRVTLLVVNLGVIVFLSGALYRQKQSRSAGMSNR